MNMNWKAGDRIECDVSFAPYQVADVPDGYIAGIASAPTTDLYGHKVLSGAFDQSIRKKGLTGPKGVKLLAFHDWHKPAGVIKRLETVNDDLKIEAQLNLNVSYVKDLYETAKQNGGLNFSVGFTLEEFSFVEGDASEDGEWLVIKQGNLMEVSVVCFPACVEATMDFIKHGPPNTLAEFEKALVADGLVKSRNEARKLTQAVKVSSHLFLDRKPSGAAAVTEYAHPLLDVNKLKPVNDLIARAKAALGSR